MEHDYQQRIQNIQTSDDTFRERVGHDLKELSTSSTEIHSSITTTILNLKAEMEQLIGKVTTAFHEDITKQSNHFEKSMIKSRKTYDGNFLTSMMKKHHDKQVY